MITVAVRTLLQRVKSFHSTKIIAKVKLKSLSGAIRLTIYPTADLPLPAQYPPRYNEQARRSNGFQLSQCKTLGLRQSDCSGDDAILVPMFSIGSFHVRICRHIIIGFRSQISYDTEFHLGDRVDDGWTHRI